MTTRPGNSDPLQDITYIYDLVGNPVKITDDAYNRVFSNSGVVDPIQTYTYDALYRLKEATGRSHSELTGNEFAGGEGIFKQSIWSELNNLDKLYIYTRKYDYDKAGNLYWIRHIAPDTSIRFTREIDVDDTTNRAILHRDGIDDPNFDDYFDANGNQTDVSHLHGVEWNYRDNIAKTVIVEREGGPPDVEYYVYDASGQRVRKVTEKYKNSTTMDIEEKIYLGEVEIKRRRERDIETSVETDNIFERVDLHVMDDKARIAIINKWNIDLLGSETDDPGEIKSRYQYSNHLGSASLELNDIGDIISYEEYFPYGGTCYITGSSEAEVKLKEYRYTGKERDDATGFYYHGARYYIPWMGKLLSADPAVPVDGVNLYQYVSGNPVSLNDPEGMQSEDPETSSNVE